ncbi:YhdH/YhfP family quinone oxidoreductase [Rapidithrix thailandica]|uniref:YhdH/YhfP family quinone oxidoreductase n=1 Tax=Rapidithrix thailandica TaxID=413964 RepID=A0AAW9RRV7_9BACT
MKFQAFRVFKQDNGSVERKIVTMNTSELSEGEVLVKVVFSGLNYKDALCAKGHPGVAGKFPLTPGIDAAGEVVQSTNQQFKEGDKVLLTGYRLGMAMDGGFGEYIRVPAAWIVPLPKELSLRESMVYGTAGFTAALSVYRLTKAGQTPEMGPVLVTGAAGGVGSFAVLLLKKLGFEVIAGTSRLDDAHDTVVQLNADKHVDKNEIDDTSGRPLLKARWAGAVDVVGGNVLATALKACKPWGNVTACGNIASHELHTTVYPFILNGVSLLGIDSQNCPMPIRLELWQHLAEAWKVQTPGLVKEIPLEGLEEAIQRFLSKKNRGQVLLKHA